jgi:Fe-S-cluster-containing hydrogenase component 2/CRP-like cAMP-binding protein
VTALRQTVAEAVSVGDDRTASQIRLLIAADTASKREEADRAQQSDPRLAARLRDAARAEEVRKVATVQLSIPLPRSRRSRGWLSWLRPRPHAQRPGSTGRHPAWIPIDGPRDLDYETREGQLNEGELFGEMSCLYRAPRSATVVATRDCFMLEMLRNVLEAMNRDAGFKARLDQVYRERILRLQLRNLPILLELEERNLERLSDLAELVEIPSGGILYDENEPSDGMHLIRSGILRVMQNVSYLIGENDVTDWPALAAELAEGADRATGPRHRVWIMLPAFIRASLTRSAESVEDPEWRRTLLAALNELIKDPDFVNEAALGEMARQHHVGRAAWQRLADAARGSERELVRCQRLLLEALYGNKLPERKAGVAGDEVSFDYHPGDVRDWKAAASALVDGGAKQGDPKCCVWNRLGEPVQAVLREARGGAELDDAAKQQVVDALNDLLRGRPFLTEADFQDFLASKKPAALIREFLPSSRGWVEHDYHRTVRAFNRFLLDAVFPRSLATSRRPEGPPKTLAYRSRGEAIGEMSLLEGTARTATCVAYGHPDDDPDREVGPIQLVRISRELFEELKQASPPFRRHVENLVTERKAETRARTAPSPSGAPASVLSGRAEELGLLQGQKLMLIDLERCTRCDECVDACVNTHDDGRSRLFLDGPRFGNFLVPTTCRSCLDPVCMIGCPVGSIHRGGNGEIIIEDWCIGCEACAEQCPYGAIQMHKEGLIPESSYGWRFAPVSASPAGWTRRDFRDARWPQGRAPFVLDRDFRSLLQEVRNGRPATNEAVAFRYPFDIAPDLLAPEDQLILGLTTMDENAAVWINGQPVVGPGCEGSISRRKSRDHGWWEIEAELPTSTVRRGRNVVAVQVNPTPGASDRLLDLRLDREVGATVKLVDQKAVVCDLCSAQYGQRPACVTACPHDAAIRISALSQLPQL